MTARRGAAGRAGGRQWRQILTTCSSHCPNIKQSVQVTGFLLPQIVDLQRFSCRARR